MIPTSSFFKSAVLLLGLAGTLAAATPAMHRILLVTGQSNKYHDWTKSSPLVKQYLEETGLFTVDVATSPAHGADMSTFRPDFKPYAAVVVVYEGDEWPAETKAAFVAYVKNGGGFVTVHDTDNAFPYWPEWNEMIGIGGWGLKADGNLGARDEKWGPMVKWRAGRQVLVDTPGKAGTHPAAHDFLVTTRAPEDAIMQGLPAAWMHAHDEIYSNLRGPAKNLTVLATAFPDPAKYKGATGENEPMLMALTYGKGRVFHTTLGHVGPRDTAPIASVTDVGYIVTLQRGTEWAATGRVTQAVPADFPTAEKTSNRN